MYFPVGLSTENGISNPVRLVDIVGIFECCLMSWAKAGVEIMNVVITEDKVTQRTNCWKGSVIGNLLFGAEVSARFISIVLAGNILRLTLETPNAADCLEIAEG